MFIGQVAASLNHSPKPLEARAYIIHNLSKLTP